MKAYQPLNEWKIIVELYKIIDIKWLIWSQTTGCLLFLSLTPKQRRAYV